jgi:hypothetical protein
MTTETEPGRARVGQRALVGHLLAYKFEIECVVVLLPRHKGNPQKRLKASRFVTTFFPPPPNPGIHGAYDFLRRAPRPLGLICRTVPGCELADVGLAPSQSKNMSSRCPR